MLRRRSTEQSQLPKPRREGHGLGPFSGTQLTVMVVTLMIVVGFPFAAFAVTGNNVFVTDASSGLHAKVDAKNNLNTGIHDPVNGNAARVNGFGQLAMTGPVTANVAYPTGAIVHSLGPVAVTTCPNNTCEKLIAPPAGKALVVTGIHIDVYTAPNPTTSSDFMLISRSNNGTCSFGTTDLNYEIVDPLGRGVIDLRYDLPGGLPVPAGTAVCISKTAGGIGAELTAWGYSVASTAVPASAPAPGAPTGAALLNPRPRP